MTRHCPGCRSKLDGHMSAATNPTSAPDPRPGCIAVCMHCAAALIYTDELQLRALTVEEWLRLDNETRKNIGAATATVAAVQLYASHCERTGSAPKTWEQLLRWALFGREHDG